MYMMFDASMLLSYTNPCIQCWSMYTRLGPLHALPLLRRRCTAPFLRSLHLAPPATTSTVADLTSLPHVIAARARRRRLCCSACARMLPP
jgi:hypothetical protein